MEKLNNTREQFDRFKNEKVVLLHIFLNTSFTQQYNELSYDKYSMYSSLMENNKDHAFLIEKQEYFEIRRKTEIEANRIKYKNHRYAVCAFPSLMGTPIITNFNFFAYILGFLRAFINGGKEVRVIDRINGDHILVL